MTCFGKNKAGPHFEQVPFLRFPAEIEETGPLPNGWHLAIPRSAELSSLVSLFANRIVRVGEEEVDVMVVAAAGAAGNRTKKTVADGFVVVGTLDVLLDH
mmetsp:Transcript_25862/g.60087  ORF Transcript_25862/g.60087 Transcript_25862/m.60087 type:complete len:100 (+) Transcript_25862:954-1253(+)